MSIDLSTRYGNLHLQSPIVVGACPLTADEQTRVAIESAGAGAVVLPSLFEEQLILWNHQKGFPLSACEQAILDDRNQIRRISFCESAESYLSIVNRASTQMSIPVIASINGEHCGNWLDFAGELEEAGAAAIELTVHHPPPNESQSPVEIEQAIVDQVAKVDQAISIPLFLKLGRQYTSIAHLSRRLLSGAQGLVMFGRTPIVDICLDTMSTTTHWELTQAGSITQSLGSIMRVHSYCPAMPVAACGGIGSATDVIKVLLAGADVAMVTSAVYREGPDLIRTLIDGLIHFMDQHQMTSMKDLQAARPILYSSDEERIENVKSLSSRLDKPHDQTSTMALSGDRFGHPTVHASDATDES